MDYERPEIDVENLGENRRLNLEEYEKAVNYVKGLILGATRELISAQKEEFGEEALKELSDLDLLKVFKVSREAYSFLGILPERDIVSIMREVFSGNLERELESSS